MPHAVTPPGTKQTLARLASQQALVQLLAHHLMEGGGPLVVVGASGSGKSTAARLLYDRLREELPQQRVSLDTFPRGQFTSPAEPAAQDAESVWHLWDESAEDVGDSADAGAASPLSADHQAGDSLVANTPIPDWPPAPDAHVIWFCSPEMAATLLEGDQSDARAVTISPLSEQESRSLLASHAPHRGGTPGQMKVLLQRGAGNPARLLRLASVLPPVTGSRLKLPTWAGWLVAGVAGICLLVYFRGDGSADPASQPTATGTEPTTPMPGGARQTHAGGPNRPPLPLPDTDLPPPEALKSRPSPPVPSSLEPRPQAASPVVKAGQEPNITPSDAPPLPAGLTKPVRQTAIASNPAPQVEPPQPELRPEAPVVKPASKLTPDVPEKPRYLGDAWLLEQPPSATTLQVMLSRDEKSVRQLIDRHHLADSAAYYLRPVKGQLLYCLVVGSYPDRESAASALTHLPAELRSLSPWRRSMASVQADIRRRQSSKPH